MGVERYFSLKTQRGPKEQVGLVVKSDLEGRIKELTEMLQLKKIRESRGNHYYNADANVDINGRSIGKKSIIGLKVDSNGWVVIYKQPSIAMVIEEIDKYQAQITISHVCEIRLQRSQSEVIVVAPKNAPIY